MRLTTATAMHATFRYGTHTHLLKGNKSAVSFLYTKSKNIQSQPYLVSEKMEPRTFFFFFPLTDAEYLSSKQSKVIYPTHTFSKVIMANG